ncbi:putative reverse transcriptase domain-containing protein [Tanacetum coccineum]
MNEYLNLNWFDAFCSFAYIAIHPKVPSTLLDHALSIFTPMGNIVVISHELRNCLLSVGDNIRSVNLLPLEMSDFNIILGMEWLTEHRATIDCHTKRVIFGNLNNLEFIYPWFLTWITTWYYRRFVEGFSLLALPLTKPIRKGEKFIWNKERDKSFEELKRRLVSFFSRTYSSFLEQVGYQFKEVDINKKTETKQNDKTEHGMQKTLHNQAKVQKCKAESNNNESAVKPDAGTEEN